MSKNKIVLIGILVVILLAIAGIAKVKLSKSDSEASASATYEVKRGPLTISVIESGTIKAREQIIIKNEVEGKTSIIYLIPEGEQVQKGDLLVELDASTLEDNKIDQEIRVQNAEASYINAKENLAVVENQAKSDLDLANLNLDFARQDLKKYLEGEYPNELKKAEAQITLSQEELTRAQETLKWSKTLYDEKYLSQTELQADQLAEKKTALNLDLAKNNLNLLTDFTYQRQLAQLNSDVSQAEMALERTTRKANANVVQAQADLKAKEAEFNRQKDKLEKIIDQIGKTRIVAPADGLVIYATSAQTGGFRGNVEPLDEGQDVRERQELIYLPTANSSKAEITVHESNLEKIHIGMPGVITVDALPGKKFLGTVASIAPLPDAQRMWMNPDLKVYTTEIYIEGNGGTLRTGMSCQAEIVIQQYPDALSIPIQAVLRIGGVPTVYVKKGDIFDPRKIETGMDNNKVIHVLSGLEVGETVLLTPPLKAAATDTKTEGVIFPAVQSAENSSEVDKKINEKLKEAKEAAEKPAETISPTGGEEQKTQERSRRRQDNSGDNTQPSQNRRPRRMENMTPEQQEEMRKRFENMTPEQREEIRKRMESITPEQMEEMRKKFENMTPEEQEKLKQQFQGANPEK
jgi:HlyD family secretion protein